MWRTLDDGRSLRFPSLIGRLTTGGGLLTLGILFTFPSLIGRLTTETGKRTPDAESLFPSLIGRLTTQSLGSERGIPDRFHPS